MTSIGEIMKAPDHATQPPWFAEPTGQTFEDRALAMVSHRGSEFLVYADELPRIDYTAVAIEDRCAASTHTGWMCNREKHSDLERHWAITIDGVVFAAWHTRSEDSNK